MTRDSFDGATGSTPATSRSSTRTATSSCPGGPRTSSSAAVRTSRSPTSRTPSTRTRGSSPSPSSACPTRGSRSERLRSSRSPPGSTLSFEEMQVLLKEKGIAKQYWPERLEVIDALPRTASGKIQKFQLRDRFGEASMSTAYLVAGVRTPIGRYGGALAAVRPDDLAAHVVCAPRRPAPGRRLGAGRRRHPRLRQPGRRGQPQRRPDGRAARGPAGRGARRRRSTGSAAPGSTRSATAARAVRAGDADLVIAGGVESMTRAPFVMPKADAAWSRRAEVHDTTIGWRFVNPRMERALRHRLDAETAAERRRRVRRLARGPGRLRAAVAGARRQGASRRAGWRGRSCPSRCRSRKGDPSPWSTPTSTRARPPSRRSPRCGRSSAGGSVTAGNSSGVNDGAAALLVASEEAVSRYGLTPLARVTRVAVGRRRAARHGHRPGARRPRKLLARTGLDGRRHRPRRAQRGVRRAGARRAARASGCPTTPSTSTPTAARSPSATRSA